MAKGSARQFFEQLGDDMVTRFLRNNLQSPSDSLNLVARLSNDGKGPANPTSTSSSSMTAVGSPSANIDRLDLVHPYLAADFSKSQASAISSLATDETPTAKSQGKSEKSPSYYASKSVPRWKTSNVFTLDDFAAVAALQSLFERYGRAAHMGILDKSYRFFLASSANAALYFKVENKVAVVGGDPLCPPELFPAVLAEFRAYRKKHGLSIAFLGASDSLAAQARANGGATLHFADERVLNPLTNPVLLGKTGKRIVTQSRQLLDPRKGGLTVEVYSPGTTNPDPLLQRQLAAIYEAWRADRNRRRCGRPQAFITVYDPFAVPSLMTYIYTRGPDGSPNGFAALRKLGANGGFHLDPCIAAPVPQSVQKGVDDDGHGRHPPPSAPPPRGLTDLLVLSALAFLNRAGISYLSLGYEPLDSLGSLSGMTGVLGSLTRMAYRRVCRSVAVGGKKAYHDKFRPDEEQASRLYIVFPDGTPGLKQAMAVMHVANIRLRRVVIPSSSKSKSKGNGRERDNEPAKGEDSSKNAKEVPQT
ncbi:hypothetical protein VTK73DRAFT_7980 [Phialemonium thermophilum]|uniref:Phosphatidylglycerol lysyltransferase C-terminal domain-containing protein n=1 Tax=Phialemonium thermophilum TaxID=223376 RepID=A0ABR3WB03_9PEZI